MKHQFPQFVALPSPVSGDLDSTSCLSGLAYSRYHTQVKSNLLSFGVCFSEVIFIVANLALETWLPFPHHL